MKKIRLIFTLLALVLALLALASCNPISTTPVDPNKTYTVAFDTKGAEDDIPSQTVKRNEKVTLPEEPKKGGYSFKGWYFGNIKWNFDDNTVRQDMTLTAKWEKLFNSVTFILDESGSEPYEVVYVSGGSSVNTNPKDPTRKNYVFKGWYVGDEEWDPKSPVTEDIVVTARWTRICTVTFNTGNVIDIDPIVLEAGEKVICPDVSDVIKYRLLGWYVNGAEWNFNTPIYEDITITAEWQRIYWISFNTNGGERIEPYWVDEGTVISPPPIPYMSDHYFVGWYSFVDEFTLAEHDFTQPVTKNIKLEAKWVTYSSSGFMYHDQTRMKIIVPDEYRFAHGQYITNLKNAFNRHLIYDAETVSADSHALMVKYTEVVVGRSDRQISVEAYEELEKIQKTTDSSLRYLVYVGRVMVAEDVFTTSVCIAYDEDYEGIAMKLAIEAFINNYLNNSSLNLPRGTYLKTCFEPSDYIEPTAFCGECAIVSCGKDEA